MVFLVDTRSVLWLIFIQFQIFCRDFLLGLATVLFLLLFSINYLNWLALFIAIRGVVGVVVGWIGIVGQSRVAARVVVLGTVLPFARVVVAARGCIVPMLH